MADNLHDPRPAEDRVLAQRHEVSAHEGRPERASEELLREIHYLVTRMMLDQLKHARGKSVIRCKNCGEPMPYMKASYMQAVRAFLRDNRITVVEDMPSGDLMAELQKLSDEQWPEDV